MALQGLLDAWCRLTRCAIPAVWRRRCHHRLLGRWQGRAATRRQGWWRSLRVGVRPRRRERELLPNDLALTLAGCSADDELLRPRVRVLFEHQPDSPDRDWSGPSQTDCLRSRRLRTPAVCALTQRARSIGQSGSSDVSSTSTSSWRFRHFSWATGGVAGRIRFITGPSFIAPKRGWCRLPRQAMRKRSAQRPSFGQLVPLL